MPMIQFKSGDFSPPRLLAIVLSKVPETLWANPCRALYD